MKWSPSCALALFGVACSTGAPPAPARASLPPGVLASVAGDSVRATTVAAIAGAQGVTKSFARELAIRDALFAAAVRRDPDESESVTVAERAVLGRRILEELSSQAHAAGPPTDSEVGELTREHWLELDRPVSVRTTHAVVLVKKPDQDAPAHALAARLADALRSITDSAAFIERAQAFPAAPLELRAERLGPVTPDGRMWDPAARAGTPQTSTLDLDFTRAAHALAHPGDQSPVVKTTFGYHVILLEERIPELRTTLEQRRGLLREEAASRRAKSALTGVVTRLRAATPVEVVRAADSLTALVPVAP